MALPTSITSRTLSPQAQELVKKIKEKYTAEGKPGAAENYPGLIGKFFKWAEASGHAVNTLPEDAVEAFLDAYNPEKLSSKDVMRQQIKSITNKISAEFGINMNHLVFKKNEAPKPTRAEKRARKAAREAAHSGQVVLGVPPDATEFYDPEPMAQEGDEMSDEVSVPTAAAPAFEAVGPGGAPMMPPNAGISPQVLVVQAPAPEAPAKAAPQKPAKDAPLKPATPVTHFTVNGIAFRGPYTRISRVADGLEPGVMPGSETILFVVPTTNVVKAGDPAQFLQQFVVPQLRFPPTASQVTFVIEELTAKREPTGVRAEISVGLTNMTAMNLGGIPPAPVAAPYAPPAPVPVAPPNDRTLDFLLKRMESDIENARRREQELQEKMAKESNVQMQMMLMQMQEKASAERRALEDKMFEEQRRSRMMDFPPPPSGFGNFGPPSFSPPPPMLPLDPLPPPPPPSDVLKPVVEQLGNLTNTLINATLNRPAPAPQKDSMEIMLPFISAMNQQMMQQQQQSQAMMLQIQQANQQMMHALLTKPQQESGTEKFLAQQLQYMERRLEQKEQSAGEFERALTMLMKIKQVAPEIMGGGERSGGLMEMLVENSESILGGAAQLLSAMNGGPVAAPPQQMAGMPPQRQLPPPPRQVQAQDDAQPVQRRRVEAPAPAPKVEPKVDAPEPEQKAEEPATNGASHEGDGAVQSVEPDISAVKTVVESLGEIAKQEEVDGEKLIPALQSYFGTLGSVSEQHQNLAAQILTAFEQAESYEDVYEVTKVIRATAKLPLRHQDTRDLAKSIHMFYTEIYAAFFDGKEKKLADGEEEAAA